MFTSPIIFFGAVHDFGALYASMKNNGKSLAQLIEKYIGKTGQTIMTIIMMEVR